MVRPILIQIPESQQIVVDRDLSHFNFKKCILYLSIFSLIICDSSLLSVKPDISGLMFKDPQVHHLV